MPRWDLLNTRGFLNPSLNQRHPQHESAAFLTITAPDENRIIRVTNEQGHEIDVFIIRRAESTNSAWQICRVRLPFTIDEPQMTGKSSFISGSITMKIHGQCVKIKSNVEGHSYRTMNTPMGQMKWRSTMFGLKSQKVLVDHRGTTLARCNSSSLEILVPGDEFFVSMAMASWIAMTQAKAVEAEQSNVAVEIIGALGGA